MNPMKALVGLPPDGRLADKVHPYAERKYRLIKHYAEMFTKGMRRHWHKLVYLDLYSGPGHAVLEGISGEVATSPLIAMSLGVPFDCHVFCDADDQRLTVLRERVREGHPDAEVRYVLGDANAHVDAILAAMPPYGSHQKVLSLCVLDPYSFSDLAFETIRRLSTRIMDFLILIPQGMEAGRFWAQLERPEDHRLDVFLGTPRWRETWLLPDWRRRGLPAVVLDVFCDQMSGLGYMVGMNEVVRNSKNSPIYNLLGLSRHPRGVEFWKKAHVSSHDQMFLDFGCDRPI